MNKIVSEATGMGSRCSPCTNVVLGCEEKSGKVGRQGDDDPKTTVNRKMKGSLCELRGEDDCALPMRITYELAGRVG